MIHKPNVWACTSIGGCVTSFMDLSMPYLQFIAVLVSIAAGLWTFWTSRKDK